MARKTPVEGLHEAIESILEDYADEVDRRSAECVAKVAQAGAKALNQATRQAVTKRDPEKSYVGGWTYRVWEKRLGAEATIYNQNKPGLPHLLEHGHVSRNGTGRTFGQVPGRAHIAPVADEIAREFQGEIEVALQ